MRAKRTWRLLIDPPRDGAWNMAVDEAILTRCSSTQSPLRTTLRLYGWSPRTLSLGRSQVCAGWPNLALLRAEGIDLVRRPTGGRAVLHDRERTYAIVGSLRGGDFPGGVLDTYERVSGALVGALRSLGAGVRSAAGTHDPATVGGRHCFGTTSAHEIVWQDQKLVGSAQLRRRRAFLQHGSILLGSEPERLRRVMGDGGDAPGITDLERALGHGVESEQVDGALVSAFERVFGVMLVPGGLAGEEAELAAQLRCWKYDSASWTLAGRLGPRELRWGPLRAG